MKTKSLTAKVGALEAEKHTEGRIRMRTALEAIANAQVDTEGNWIEWMISKAKEAL